METARSSRLLGQLFQEPKNLAFEVSDRVHRECTIHIVNMPVLNTFPPLRKTHVNERPVLRFFDSYDTVGRREIRVQNRDGESVACIRQNAAHREMLQRVPRYRAHICRMKR
jgi:hypothetical protein